MTVRFVQHAGNGGYASGEIWRVRDDCDVLVQHMDGVAYVSIARGPHAGLRFDSLVELARATGALVRVEGSMDCSLAVVTPERVMELLEALDTALSMETR